MSEEKTAGRPVNERPFYESDPPLDRFFPFLAWDTFKAPFWFPLHWHERVEIVYILKGSFRVSINGTQHEGNQGDIITVNTGLIHGFFDPSPGAYARIFQFGLEIFDETLLEIQDRGLHGPVFSRRSLVTPSRDGKIHSRLEGLLMDIFEEYQQKDPGYRLVIKSKIYGLAVMFLRDIPPEQAPQKRIPLKKNNTRHLERVFSLMLENYDNPDFTLENAASEIGFSKCHFSRFLKEQTGQGFHDHLTRIRLRQAEKNLVESDQPVTDIAYNCGFRSLATFNRLFKAYTGTSPSVYRNGKAAVLPYER
ncbi:MAG: AraC family transcriptional regulator [Treponema sp.]|nr:AraC family transcriptional regulator [Treponema sp.]